MNIQPYGMIMWKIWKLNLKQMIFQSYSDLSSYLLQEHFIFVLVLSKHVESLLSFQYHSASCTVWPCTQGQENSSVCSLKYRGKVGEKGKGIQIQVQVCTEASDTGIIWTSNVLALVTARSSMYLEIRTWSNVTERPQAHSYGSLFEDNFNICFTITV